MSLQTVSDLSDADVLENNLGLYLKPVSRIKINVQLPKLNLPGQSISTYHVMEKLKEAVRPDTFIYLKSLKITSTVIKFEGELETRAACDRALARLRAAGTLKINGSADNKKSVDKLQVRAAHATAAGPTRHDWEAFFRDAKGVNEMKPGERPDTVHLQDLPIKWFNENHKSHSPTGPNDKLVKLAFGGFGKIRRLEIPSRTQNEGLNGIGKTGCPHKDNFEVYIQYEEYVEFAIAMDALRGKKLLYKDPGGKVYSADIKVDFDRTKYLSEVSIRKREMEERKSKPDIKKEDETTKNISSAASQAKESVKVPLKTVTPPEETKVTATKIPTTESKTEMKHVELSPEEKRKCHLEAEVLLRKLLLRAEKTERLKEEVKKAEKYPEPQKRPKGSESSEVHHKKSKTSNEKDQKAPESSEGKFAKERASAVDRKNPKSEKRTHSEETKREKRIKTEVYDKKHHYKLKSSSKHKEESSKPIEDSCKKEIRTVTHCDRIKKENISKYTESKNKERDDKRGIEKNLKDFKSASAHRYEVKSNVSDSNKTPRDCDDDKNHKQHEKIVNCDKTNELNNLSKPDKSKNSSSHIKYKDIDKNLYLEVNLENTLEDDKLRMLMEERKLKERLMQSYYQKQKNEEKLLEQERILKQKLVKKLKAREKEKLKDREKLRKELSGRKVLKSVLADTCTSSKKH